MSSALQYKRRVQVIVGSGGAGLSIENLRIDFEVSKDHQAAPNAANIKIYNLNDMHQAAIREQYKDLIVNAGYEGSTGVIFRGNIRHVYRYRDGNDWIVEIDAGDGDRDFTGAIVNETMAAGVSDQQLISRVCSGFSTTKQGVISGVGQTKRLRGKVVSGNARHVLSNIAKQHDCNWSIQDGNLQFVKANGVLPNEAILVNADTGMLNAPQQDDKGIKVETLLNPLYRINGRIQLNNNDIKRKKAAIDSNGEEIKEQTRPPARLDPDGFYKLYKIKHVGSTHTNDFKSVMECVSMDSSFPVEGAL